MINPKICSFNLDLSPVTEILWFRAVVKLHVPAKISSS